jgi:signal peptidase I
MESWTEKLATLSLPSVVLLLIALTVLRFGLRALKHSVFVFFSELIESATLAAALVFLILRPFVMQSFHIPTPSMRPTLIEGDHILVNKLIYRLKSPSYGDAIVFHVPKDADSTQKEYIKRLIGLPGDIIEVRPGYVQIENERFDHLRIRDVLGVPQPVSEREESQIDAPVLRLTTDAIWLGGKRITPQEFAIKSGYPKSVVLIQPGLVFRNSVSLTENFIAEDPDYQVAPYRVPSGYYYVLGDNRNQSYDSHDWDAFASDRVIGRADAIYWPPKRIRRVD